MIKTTLGKLVDAEAPLQKLAQATLPIKAAYQVKKLITAVLSEVQLFHAARDKAIKELGALREQTEAEKALSGRPEQVTAVKAENMGEFQQRILDLASIEVELQGNPLDLSSLGDYAISAVDLVLLEAVTVMPED